MFFQKKQAINSDEANCTDVGPGEEIVYFLTPKLMKWENLSEKQAIQAITECLPSQNDCVKVFTTFNDANYTARSTAKKKTEDEHWINHFDNAPSKTTKIVVESAQLIVKAILNKKQFEEREKELEFKIEKIPVKDLNCRCVLSPVFSYGSFDYSYKGEEKLAIPEHDYFKIVTRLKSQVLPFLFAVNQFQKEKKVRFPVPLRKHIIEEAKIDCKKIMWEKDSSCRIF